MTQDSIIQTPKEQEERIKEQLDKFDLKPYENIEVEDPFTGQVKTISLNRTGHNEQELIRSLADPNLSREKKDHALSMYMWERGAQSMSMMVDLFRYKGQHTKESQVFQSRMRFDFETFVNSFTRYLHNQSRLLGVTLGISIEKEKEEFEKWLKKEDNSKKGYTYVDFYGLHHPLSDKNKIALIEMAIYSLDEADNLVKSVENIVMARQAMKGGGIYVDKQGRPFSVNDPNLDEIIKKEREIEEEANKDNNL